MWIRYWWGEQIAKWRSQVKATSMKMEAVIKTWLNTFDQGNIQSVKRKIRLCFWRRICCQHCTHKQYEWIILGGNEILRSDQAACNAADSRISVSAFIGLSRFNSQRRCVFLFPPTFYHHSCIPLSQVRKAACLTFHSKQLFDQWKGTKALGLTGGGVAAAVKLCQFGSWVPSFTQLFWDSIFQQRWRLR